MLIHATSRRDNLMRADIATGLAHFDGVWRSESPNLAKVAECASMCVAPYPKRMLKPSAKSCSKKDHLPRQLGGIQE